MTEITNLSYILWDVDPDIFVIPGLNHPVRWYGLLWATALLLSQQVMYFIYKKDGRSFKEVDTMTAYIVIGAVVGARLGHVLFYDPIYYFQHPVEILFIWQGGLASHGGTIAILIAAWLFANKTQVGYLWVLDRLIIVSALCGFFIRFGNLMNSETIGIPTDVPWAFVFTRVDMLPRHPSPLYESLFCLGLLITSFVLWYKYRSRLKNGLLLGWFLIALFGFRFVAEFFKISQEAFEDDMMLNMGQLLSIPFVVCGIVILIFIANKKSPIEKDEIFIGSK
jgi:phosphatidylglycerol---prolipoprotein diacylglyceryl transferase